MDNPLLLGFVTVTIFTIMLAIGVNHPFQQLLSLWHRPGLLLRSLVAVIVVVPIVVIVLLQVLDLPATVATGLALLAASPGAPLTTKRSQMAGGDINYSASLQLTLALLAVIVTPITLAIFYGLFEPVSERVTPLQVVQQVAEVTFLPVTIGLLLQRFAPKLAERIGRPVRLLAWSLFIALFVILIALLALVPDMRGMLDLGTLPIMAMVIMVVLSLISGHLLGGPTQQQRATLAIASIARNVGLALYITTLSDHGKEFVPTIVTYAIVGALVAVPYATWSKRQIGKIQ